LSPLYRYLWQRVRPTTDCAMRQRIIPLGLPTQSRVQVGRPVGDAGKVVGLDNVPAGERPTCQSSSCPSLCAVSQYSGWVQAAPPHLRGRQTISSQATAPARAAGTCAEPHPHVSLTSLTGGQPRHVRYRLNGVACPQLGHLPFLLRHSYSCPFSQRVLCRILPACPLSLRLFPSWRNARPRSSESPSLTAVLRWTPPSSPGPASSLRRTCRPVLIGDVSIGSPFSSHKVEDDDQVGPSRNRPC